MKTPSLLFLILLSMTPSSFALDAAPKQVQLESKIVEVSRKNSEFLMYQPVDGRDAKAEFAFVITPLPDKKTKIEVTTLVYGRGADFRRWVPQNPILTVVPTVDQDGSVKMTLRPERTDIAYVDKPSVASPVVPFLFAAIGSQYEGPGAAAAGTPGQLCPVTGQPLSGHSERGDIAKGIDKAGMAAGMGLLTSQAKGQLEAQRSTFISDVPVLGFLFKTEAYNKHKKETLIFVTPKVINIPE